MSVPLLELQHVSKTYNIKASSADGDGGLFRPRQQTIHVLDDVSLQVMPNQTLCIVGESGCGKTTTGKIMTGLIKPDGGAFLYEGQPVNSLRGAAYAAFRRAVQIVHQDPYASLNPVHSIYSTLAFPLFRHKLVRNDAEARARVIELLETVDMTPAADYIDKFPHQLSGGQRQRVSIARALTVNPRVIVADEAVSMVDSSIRISLLKTLNDLQVRLGVTFVFITHDLALARYFAWEGQIAVMYLGRVIESGPAPLVTEHPQHPYTRALVSALPEPDPELTRNKQRFQLRSQDIPNLARLPHGCAFHPRCPWSVEGICDVERPDLAHAADDAGTLVACHVTGRTPFHEQAMQSARATQSATILPANIR